MHIYLLEIQIHITVPNTAAQGLANKGANKKVIFKNCAPFTNCISRMTLDDASYIDVVMPMYNLIEYSDNYLKISGILWQFYKDVPALNAAGELLILLKLMLLLNRLVLKNNKQVKQATIAQKMLK